MKLGITNGRRRYRGLMLAAALVLVSASCGEEKDKIDPAERVCWTDDTTGLCWQVEPRDCPVGMTSGIVDTPEEYCALLGQGWRAPIIDELRSLLRGCPANELGGECGVTDPGCLDSELGCAEGCDMTVGCEWYAGPGQGGWYQPPELAAPKCHEMVSTSGHWYVSFLSGTIEAGSIAEAGGVRCVRDDPL